MSTTEKTEERPHHPTSPSSLESIEACPCFKSRQQKKLHERTIAGTRSHNAAEKEEDDNRISDEDAGAVAECLEHVASRRQALIEEAATARYASGAKEPEAASRFEAKVVEINECYLAVDDFVFPDGTQATTAGYLDKLILSWNRKRANICDWKFGKWPVTHASENLQGIAYALGVFHQYPTVDEVTVDFLQPHIAERPFTTAVFRRSDIPKHYARICAVVMRAREARSKGDFSMARPTAPVCGFCEHLGRCDKALALFIEVGKKFYPLEVPESVTPTQVMDENQTSMAMRLASIVSVWAKAFKNVLANRCLAGDAPVPAGFSITTTERRELVDLKTYRKLALKYISAAEFDSTLETTFGAVETLITEQAPRGQKKAVLDEFQKAALEAGAVVVQPPFSFLKARPTVKKEE